MMLLRSFKIFCNSEGALNPALPCLANASGNSRSSTGRMFPSSMNRRAASPMPSGSVDCTTVRTYVSRAIAASITARRKSPASMCISASKRKSTNTGGDSPAASALPKFSHWTDETAQDAGTRKVCLKEWAAPSKPGSTRRFGVLNWSQTIVPARRWRFCPSRLFQVFPTSFDSMENCGGRTSTGSQIRSARQSAQRHQGAAVGHRPTRGTAAELSATSA